MIGARTLSQSGRQLFVVDKFRDTSRPLLSILSDPNSIFISGLQKFKRRTLYANIVNDRSAVYYTTGISKTDPFTDLSKVQIHYLDGHGEVIVDANRPVTLIDPLQKKGVSKFAEMMAIIYCWIKRLPFVLALVFFVPLGVIAFLINSAIQTVKSGKRIRLHEKGLAGINVEKYRVPLIVQSINDMREAVEETYESLNSVQEQEYLRSEDDEVEVDSDGEVDKSATEIMTLERQQSTPQQPTLALTSQQFEMIKHLDNVGWRKYPVHICQDRHTHAAIILRYRKKTFQEGKVVLNHWLKDEFLLE